MEERWGSVMAFLKRGRMPSEISPRSNLTFSRACLPSPLFHVLTMGGGENAAFISAASSSVIREEEGREESERGGEEAKQSWEGMSVERFFSLPPFFRLLNKATRRVKKKKSASDRSRNLSGTIDFYFSCARVASALPPPPSRGAAI